MQGVTKYLRSKKNILDVGSGPLGSGWWSSVDSHTHIVGIDNILFPESVPPNVSIYKYDANKLSKIHRVDYADKYYPVQNNFIREKIKWVDNFDMVVANHVLEHVDSPEDVVSGISKVLKKNGLVYVGFPDSDKFTDIFYHLIHPDSGGHVQLLNDRIVEKIFTKRGFKLISKEIWPDDWSWFEKLYNWKSYMWPENKFLTQEKIKYMAGVFQKELTTKKGYFYGWEMVFMKVKSAGWLSFI